MHKLIRIRSVSGSTDFSQELETTHAVSDAIQNKIVSSLSGKVLALRFLDKTIKNLFYRYNFNIFQISFLMELILIGSFTSEKLDVSAQILSFADC